MTKPNKIFSSKGNGKLMISGEYLVLKGAKALTVPLQLGQKMEVFSSNSNELNWMAYHTDGLWNSVTFNDKLTITDTTNSSFGKQTQKILRNALKLSKFSINDIVNKKIITQLEFNPNWGLGSSSTLIYNLSKYLNIDPYELLKHTFGGSGYDIANAEKSMPLFFLLVKNEPRSVMINFDPPFHENIYFVYSGQKKSSKDAIKGFAQKKISESDISQISTLSTLIAVCTNLTDFQELINEHEKIISHIIKKTPIKQKHFSDFDGSIKSLGAWGGDFFMAVSNQPADYIYQYFKSKKLDTIFTYKDLILSKPCH